MAFHDLSPAAALHLLVIPRQHIVDIKALRKEEHLQLGQRMHFMLTQLLVGRCPSMPSGVRRPHHTQCKTCTLWGPDCWTT